MKIIFVSMPSVHAFRWIENLYETEHELYWFDVTGKNEYALTNKVTILPFIPKRKIPYLKGEHFLRKKVPYLYSSIQSLLEVTTAEVFEHYLKEIQPDIIHSFEMQSCSYPILKTMKKFPQIKWIYSCWGSDLFYYQSFYLERIKIKKALRLVHLFHSDNYRDIAIAKKIGYQGNFTEIIPGGSGYHLDLIGNFQEDYSKRKIILVKGYEHKFGRALNVIKALEFLYAKGILKDFQIKVFGSHDVVMKYIKEKQLPFYCYTRNQLQHTEVLNLMGDTAIYIGNSISDGTPNTLIEALLQGAFPIQSSPGGVIDYLVEDGNNAIIIKNPENIDSIINTIKFVINSYSLREKAFNYNVSKFRAIYDFDVVKNKIVALYR